MQSHKPSVPSGNAVHESMTGYAIHRKTFSEHELTPNSPPLWIEIELQSVNGRYLEVQWRGDRALQHFEITARQRLKQSFTRGRLTVTVAIQLSASTSPQPLYVLPDPPVVETQSALLQIDKWQQYLLEHFPDSVPLSIYEYLKLLRASGVTSSSLPVSPQSQLSQIFNDKKIHAPLIEVLDQTILLLKDARQLEAKNILPLMRDQAKELYRYLETIINTQHNETDRITQKVATQLNALKMEIPTLDASRLTQEAALLLIRHDIGEEIERLRSHLKNLNEQLSTTPTNTLSIGKSLDFLMQELNREVNTIASKTTGTLASECTMAMKLIIDKIREQTQNLQ